MMMKSVHGHATEAPGHGKCRNIKERSGILPDPNPHMQNREGRGETACCIQGLIWGPPP